MAQFDNHTGFVISRYDAKDADQVINLVIENGEKIAIYAKAARKHTSKKSTQLDLLNLVKVKLVQGKAKLATLTEIKVINDYSQFKSDYTGLVFCQFICEILNMVASENEDPGVFVNTFNLVENALPQKYLLLAATLMLRLMYNSGDMPKLNEDVYSGAEITTDQRRIKADIGYTTSDNEDLPQVSDRIYKTQRFIIKQDFRLIQQIDLKKQEEQQIFQIHLDWFQYLHGKQVKSGAMLMDAA